MKVGEKTADEGIRKYVSEEVIHRLAKSSEWRELRLLVTAAARTSVLR